MPGMEEVPVAKINTDWSEIDVVGGPEIALTVKGYTPVLIVKVGSSDVKSKLYIAPKSLAEKLEPLRQKNGESFIGLKFKVRKESMEKFAKYELEKM